MGKRGKRRRRSHSAVPSSDATIDEGVMVTGIQCLEPWPTNVFEESASEADGSQYEFSKCWQRLEQRKRRRLEPTPIQLHTWPLLMRENDHSANLVAIAPTGSGKTLAYGLPLVVADNGNSLILVPTRELARQVERELTPISDKKVICIYGGVDRDSQVAALRQEATASWIVASTPGRLVDILNDSEMPHMDVASIVLDEGDRLSSNIDMANQVDEIFQRLRPTRVSLFSATSPANFHDKWNEWVGKTRVCIMVNTSRVGSKPTPVSETALEEASTKRKSPQDDNDGVEQGGHEQATDRTMDFSRIPSNVIQILHVCAGHKKPRKLLTMLKMIRKEEGRRKGLCLVFFARIKTLQYVHKLLNQAGFSSVQFHSQLSQSIRETTLTNFKSGKTPTMLATDIAARGIHVNNIEYIINYDFPGGLDQYVHRCGRGGRNQTISAKVYSFFTRDMAPMAKDVVQLLKSSNSWLDPNLLSLINEGPPKKKQCRPVQWPPTDTGLEDAIEDVDDKWDDGQFASLSANRIVLKRAGHVNDASESEEQSDPE